MSARLIVLKLGSSVLQSEADLPSAAGEIAGYVGRGWRVLAVVSAIGNATDELIRRAQRLAPTEGHAEGGAGDPAAPGASPIAPAGDKRQTAFAALLETGEAVSAALVGLALTEIGIDCTVLDAGRVGPFTRGPRLDAVPHAFDVGTVRRALERDRVTILPGFVGRDADGRHTLLGRGGSDLTALFVAHSLSADRCRLLKDVDGIYEYDPALRGRRRPRRFATLDWDGALKLEDAILQQKAAQFAYRYRVQFEVGSTGDAPGTLVGAAQSRFARPARAGAGARARGGKAAPCRRAALAVEGGLAS